MVSCIWIINRKLEMHQCVVAAKTLAELCEVDGYRDVCIGLVQDKDHRLKFGVTPG